MGNFSFLFSKRSKKGQITVFIIIAIIIVGLGVFLFISKDVFIKKDKPYSPNIAPIVNFIENCFEETLEDAVHTLSKNGGYYSPINVTETGESYYLFEGNNYFPSKENIEKDLSKYIDNMFFICSKYFEDFSDYEIEQSNVESSSKLFEDKIILNVHYPLSIQKGSSSVILRDFEIEYPSTFGSVYTDISFFIEEDVLSEDFCLSCISDISEYDGLSSYVSSQKNNTFIFIITDKNPINKKPIEWVFANKY